jgi:NitT/TauT family transport system ATP-binding protein
VVLAPRPARITDIVEMPFRRPRDLDLQRQMDFQDMVGRLRHLLTGAAA